MLEYLVAAINLCVVILCFFYLYKLTKATPFIVIGLSHLSSLVIRAGGIFERVCGGTFMTTYARDLNLPTHILAVIGYAWLYFALKKHYCSFQRECYEPARKTK